MIPRLLILSPSLLLGDLILFLCPILDRYGPRVPRFLILCWILVSIYLFPVATSNFKTASVSAASATEEPDAEACQLGVAIVFGTARSAGSA